MEFSTVLFDLDGTLTESGEGIARSVQYALRQMNFPELPNDILRKFVGPPLLESFVQYANMTEQQAEEAVRQYRVRFADVGWKENRVYPGIAQLLRALKRNRIHVALASSKPQHFCERILEHFAIAPYFDAVCGSDPSDNHAGKAKIVQNALKTAPAGRACIVGDRKYDVQGAHANGIPAIGVCYGYGSREELELAGADYIAADVDALYAALLGDQPKTRGTFITFEGGDGCGKSTQAQMAGEYLASRGFDVLVMREPGGCPIAERIRELVLDIHAGDMTDECEALLFAAARVQSVADAKLPALAAGKIVLCDRYVHSSYAYQAHGRELGEQFLRQINAHSIRRLMPDYTLLYDVDRDLARARMQNRQLDRIEVEGGALVRRVDDAYRMMARAEPDKWRIIDANGTIEQVFDLTRAALDKIIPTL